MHFLVDKQPILNPLRAVSGIVERKAALQASPILLNALLKVNEYDFSFTTTDQEIELVARGKLAEKATETGVVTVPVRKLMDVLKTLPEDKPITIKTGENKLVLTCGRSRFVLSTLPSEQFPALEDKIGEISFEISQKKLRYLMEQVSFAMAEQDVRHFLNGLLLEIKKGVVHGVAADGHRLALDKIEIGRAPVSDLKVIVPRKGILELERVLEDTEDTVEVVLGNNHIRMMTDHLQFTSKLLEGRFPDYERIVSAKGDKSFVGRKDVLKDAFLRAAALFDDRFKAIRLKLTQGLLKILATNAEQDEVEEDVEIDYAGNDLEIAFNVKYLLDLLNVIPTERVKFTFGEGNQSAHIEGVGAQAVYIIMPMKV